MAADFQFSLLENGLDFLLSSLEHLTAASAPANSKSEKLIQSARQKRHLKYALLHLCSSIELILKERLRQEDWRLLFVDPDKADEDAYEAGDFTSINFQEVQSRLESECGITFLPKQKADLKAFRLRRNKVEHFGAVDSLLAVQSSVTQMVSFLVDFVEEAFESESLEEEEGLITDIRSKLGECSAVVEDRCKQIEKAVADQYSTITCPTCQQDAMSADGGTVKCLFCNYSTDSESAAEEYVANILGMHSRYAEEKDGGEWPLTTCPECGSNSFVTQVPGTYDTHHGYCFCCGTEYSPEDSEECYDCGELYRHSGEAGHHICSDCFQARVMKDD
jgi:hypothetical protein